VVFKGINHIAVAVRDLDKAVKYYLDVLGGVQECPVFQSATGDRKMARISVGKVSIELITPLGSDSPIAEFLEKHGEGLHHIGIDVGDIEEEIEALDARGVGLLNKEPIIRKGHRAAYINPEAINGVSVELMEKTV